MNDGLCRRSAAVLLIVAWVLRVHPWVPALLVGGLVSWVLLHKRLEGGLGDALVRVWRRAWPPGALVLIPLLAGSTLVFWTSDVPITAKALPVALSMLGFVAVALGTAWTFVGPVLDPNRRPSSPRKAERV